MAWVAVRWGEALLEKFESVTSRVGSRQKAIFSVARKLMVRIYTIVQNGEDYIKGLAA